VVLSSLLWSLYALTLILGLFHGTIFHIFFERVNTKTVFSTHTDEVV